MPHAHRPTAPSAARWRRFVHAARLACTALALAPVASAQTFIVDNQHPAASSSGPGTEEQPYSTVLAAITAHKGPGVTILVHPGVYREQISIPASGTAALPCVVQASGSGVVMEGAEDLSGESQWDETEEEVFLAEAVDWSPKQVFVDDVRLALSTEAPADLPESSFVYVSGEGLYVHLDGVNPGTRTVLVSKRNNGFTISSRSFVTLDGFEIVRTNDRGINMHTCTDLVIRNLHVRNAGGSGIHANNCQRLLIAGNRSNDSGMHGIALTAGTTASTVRGNECARSVHPTVRLGNGIYLFGAPDNVLEGNDVHHNQDSGVNLGAGSDSCLLTNNRSWGNGDHGYDHLGASGTVHFHDLAYGNFRDGFSFEGNGVDSRLYNSIAVDNGLTQNRFDLWVEAASLVGFASDHNLFWNSTPQAIIRTGATLHTSLATHQASGLDLHSVQADPRFADAPQGDFSLGAGSPAIDAATSDDADWPAADALARVRSDDLSIPNTGAGAIPFADLGPLERFAVDSAPLVVSPAVARAVSGGVVSFTVTASDPDGEPIAGLVMVPVRMPAGHGAQFVPEPDHSGGTFTWVAGELPSGNYLVEFVASNALSGSSKTPIALLPALERPEAPVIDEPPGDASAPMDDPAQGAPGGPVAFSLTLEAPAEVEWGVYDVQGRELWSESRSAGAGRLKLAWNGLDRNGARAPSGVYFARVRVGGARFVRRIVRF